MVKIWNRILTPPINGGENVVLVFVAEFREAGAKTKAAGVDKVSEIGSGIELIAACSLSVYVS